ncbi:unnamed protein product [Auanema sp. JU1783]|nr:unnamed protein product [Auanema sp. JU1783]
MLKKPLTTKDIDVISVKTEEDKLWEEDEKPFTTKTYIFNACFRDAVRKGHILKLVTLMICALIHMYFMNSFIRTFGAYENMVNQIETVGSASRENISELDSIRFVLRVLVDYKKNLWITVGAMCALLATSSFFVLLLDESRFNKLIKVLICIVDMIVFTVLPCLFVARRLSAINLKRYWPDALNSANGLTNTTSFTNDLGCSITELENVPLCSHVVLASIFPIKVLEYLVILCVLTGAYIALAYLIEYCIRHFFPPSNRLQKMRKEAREPLVLPPV